MASKRGSIDEIQSTIDTFTRGLPTLQRKQFDKVYALLKDLSLDADGNIKNTIENLKVIGRVNRELQGLIDSLEYQDKVASLQDAIDKVNNVQTAYFIKVFADFEKPPSVKELQKIALDNTTDSLIGAGVNENVLNSASDIVEQHIRDGSSFSQMVDKLKEQMVSQTEIKTIAKKSIDLSNYTSDKRGEVLAKELSEKLKEIGFKTSGNIATSETQSGTSHYVIAADKDGVVYKFRVSDHSVSNRGRMSEEYHINGDNIGTKIVQAEKEAFPERFIKTNKIYVAENKKGGKGESYLQPEDKIISEKIDSSGAKSFLVEREGATGIIERKIEYLTEETITSPSKLVSYSKQIINDSLSGFSRNYHSLVTADLGLVWFEYLGALVDSSRPVCIAAVDKKFFHKSELPSLARGVVNEVSVGIEGMMPGTNGSNIMNRCGGFNCSHQLVPISSTLVPTEIRRKFEKDIPPDSSELANDRPRRK